MLVLVAKLWESLAEMRRHAVRATEHELWARIPEGLLARGAHRSTIGLAGEARVRRGLHERLRWVHARVHGRHGSHVGGIGRLRHHHTRMVRHRHGLGPVVAIRVPHTALRVGSCIIRVEPGIGRA